MNNEQEILFTKIFLLIAGTSGALTLTDIDMILGIVLKAISIISFSIIIIINFGKLVSKIKEWLA